MVARGHGAPVILLTATWSSCGTCSTVEGGGAASRRAARVCEAKVAATG
jgi:hypothetical protein